MREKIINLSKKLGIDLVGFAEVKYYEELENILITQQQLKFNCSFQTGKIEDKCFKSDKYNKYKTAIVFGLSYNNPNFYLEEIKNSDSHLSSHSWGEDYHNVFTKKLNEIKKYIDNNNGISDVFVDNNELDEKYLAYLAGLGFYGKNNLLINEVLGSFFFIGVILTDLVMDYNKPLEKKCIDCNACAKACPTGAINESGILNSNICLSYLTQKKNLEQKLSLNKCIYGCDICSSVCPYNKNIKPSNNFVPTGIEFINKNNFFNMSEEEYKTVYKKNASFWRGKKVVERNIDFLESSID